MGRFGRYLRQTRNLSLVLILATWQVAMPLGSLIKSQPAYAAPVCVVDTAGANDVSGQKDLTRLCADYANVPSTVATTWNWDLTGTNGANTMDACSLFDVDGNGNADYAVCVITQNNPATMQSFVTYSCGDDKNDRCTSPVTPVSSGSTTCNVSQQNNDPFPAGASFPADTQGTCTVDLSTVGGSSATLIDVCSYPSSQPNSDPSDCVIAQPSAGKLEVRKNLVPGTDSGLFNLQVDGITKAANVGNNGTTGELVYPDGNHTVGETAGTNTSLSGYSSSIECRDLNGTGAVIASNPNGTSVQVNLADDADVVCIITNTASGTITIVKDAQPNAAQDFSFTGTGTGITPFTLDDDNDPALINSKTFTNLVGGTYTFTEAAVTGWDLTNLACSQGASFQVNGSTVSVSLGSGQNVVCTFTNVNRGQLVVHKTTLPANDPTVFSITASGTGTIFGGAVGSISDSTDQTYEVAPGTYSVSETVPAGWSKTGDTCQNVVVAPGATVHCTITNTKLAKLKIVKDAVPNSGQDFGFSTTGNGLTGFTLDDDNDGTLPNNQQFSSLNPGDYSVSEVGVSGWDLTGASCEGTNSEALNSTTLSFSLAAGDDVTCTFTNTQRASIAGTKFNVNADGTTVTTLSGWTINLLQNGQIVATTQTDQDGNFSFQNLINGSYALEEMLQNGWTQIYSPTNVELDPGESSTDNDFGNFQNGSISGFKFNDLNGNGVRTDNEPKLSGWTMTLSNDSNDPDNLLNNVIATTQTDQNGNYSFPDLAPGTYQVCETQQAGWLQTLPANNGCHVFLIDQSGESNPANFGNQGRGTITVVKNVDTNADGQIDQSDVSNWTWDIDGSGNFATGSANAQSVAAGAHTISEDQQTNYHVTASSCTGEATPGQPTTSLPVTVSPGEDVVCTFTNTRDTGTLTVIKDVVNDNGGTAAADNFNVHVTQNGTDVAGSPTAGSDTGTQYTLLTGDYEVGEDQPLAGYEQTSIVCDGQTTDQVTVTAGQNKVCTITNDDIAPQLTVIKHVINDNSGTSDAEDFTVNVTATNPSDASFPGAEAPGTTITLNSGGYSVAEGDHDGYNVSYSADCTGTIALGETKTCTITNNDIAHPNIHIEKTGPAIAHEGDNVAYTFTVTNIGDTPLMGVFVTDNLAGSAVYQSGDTNTNNILEETETWIFTANYTVLNGQVADVVNTATACAVDPDQTQVCDDDDHRLDVLHPSISVTKDGPLLGYEGQLIGYTFVVTNTGDTVLTNVGISDDIANLETCDDATLSVGESTNCTASFLIPTPQIPNVVNTVIASGTDPLGQTVTNNDNHILDVLHPLINVVKTGPTVAHEGDTVTYTFTVTNTGDTPLSNLTVQDNIAGTASYVSGDTNGNSKLDLTEAWIYTADFLIPAEQAGDVINTVTACGLDPIQATVNQPVATCDNDGHQLDVLHPKIQVVKSGPANAYQGDNIVFTYFVTNIGDTPLAITSVNDNVTGDASYVSGDTNNNSLLELGETWVYTDGFTVPTPSGDIINTVTACGVDQLQGQDCDDDSHTTHIFHPTIIVNKEVVTSQQSDPGLFNLQIDGSTQAANVGDGGTTGAVVVTPGNHSVGETAGTETDLTDYVVSFSQNCAEGNVFVDEDDVVTCTITNTRKGSITIIKDAQPDSSQAFGFSGSLGNFNLTDDGVTPTLATQTFSQLTPGSYSVNEANVAGWDLSNLTCTTEEDTDLANYNVDIELVAGENVTCTFTNQKRGQVVVTKYNDLNRDGDYDPTGDPAEPALPNWEMVLDENTQTTGLNGTTTFVDVKPGVYILDENLQQDWNRGVIACFTNGGQEVEIESSGRSTDHGYYVYITPGATVNCHVGNYQEVILQIDKAVDKPAPTANLNGDTLTYSIVVSVPENSGASFDTTVTDLPPEGIGYVGGSWTATLTRADDSTVNLKTNGTTAEPNYGSPGVWNLGTLLPGEFVTLTYKAIIGANVSFGTYPDLAFTKAFNTPNVLTRTQVVGTCVGACAQGFGEPFVSTAVAVGPNSPNTPFTGQVQGVLVNTGQSLTLAQFVVPALLILATGLMWRQTKTPAAREQGGAL